MDDTASDAEKACQFLHGLPCEETVLPLPAHLDDLLPEGELVEYGDLVSLDYRWPPNARTYTHKFTVAKILVAGPGLLYVVGNFTVTPGGIENNEGFED